MNILFTKFWREWLLIAAIIVAATMWHQYKNEQIARGRAEQVRDEANHNVDSLEAALDASHAVSVIVDTVPMNHWLTAQVHDTLWRHDTIYVPGDTTRRLAVPVKTQAREDSIVHACVDRMSACEVFRRDATAIIAELKRANKAEIVIGDTKPTSVKAKVGYTVLGILAGATGALLLKR